MANEIVETRTDEATGREYYVYTDGTEKWKDGGRIKKQNPAYALTPERGLELQRRGKVKGIMSQLKGLAASNGVELPPDADMEQVIDGAGDALEAITRHFGKTFLKSENLRGMGESYRQLAAPLVGEKPEAGATYNTVNIEMPEELARAITELHSRLVGNTQPSTNNFADVLEGKFSSEE